MIPVKVYEQIPQILNSFAKNIRFIKKKLKNKHFPVFIDKILKPFKLNLKKKNSFQFNLF